MKIHSVILTIFLLGPTYSYSMMCSDLLNREKTIRQYVTAFGQSLEFNHVESAEMTSLPSFKRTTRAFLDIVTFKKIRKTIGIQEIGSKKDVYLGFLENGHVYLIIDGQRLDGEALYIPPKFRKSAFLTEGVVVKFKDPGENIKKSLTEFINSNGKPLSLTCSSGICMALRETMSLVDRHGQNYTTLFPSKLLEAVITGKVGLELDLKPNIELYLLGDMSFDSIVRLIKKAEVTRPAPFVLGATAFSLIGLYIGL